MRTVDAYTRTLQRFFGTTGKTPEQITPPDVFGFAHGIGPSGREPAAITIGARLACISSFYRFLIRMESGYNPLTGLLHRSVRQPDDRELRKAEVDDVDLDVDDLAVHADHCAAVDFGEHSLDATVAAQAFLPKG